MGRIRVLRRAFAATVVFVAGVVPLIGQPAHAVLKTVGPVDPRDGFPVWYQDNTGTALQLCFDAALCTGPLPDQAAPPSMTNIAEETFYWRATSTMATAGGNGKALLAMAVEAAFANGPVVDGDQVTFGRIRIRADHLVPGASYTVTHPFGVKTLTASNLGALNDTVDAVCAPPCDFSVALGTAIGPFLRWDPAVDPQAPTGHLGNPFIDHPVTGSPNNTNFFRIDGPAVGGVGVNTITTNLFGLEGAIADQAAAIVSPSTLAFATQRAGTSSAAKTVRMTNGGTQPLAISATSVDTTAFTMTANTCTGANLAPGASCTVGVAFAPVAAGDFTGTLSFSDGAPGSPHTVSLTGTGVAPVANVSPTSIAFGDESVSTASAPVTITVTNTGSSPLSVGTATKSGSNPGDYTLADSCGGKVVAVNASCSLTVRFAPKHGGASAAAITIPSDDPNSPTVVSLSGSGIPGSATVSATSLSFADRMVGTMSAAQTFTITSNGPDSLVVTGVSVTGVNSAEFPMTTTCANAVLPSGSSCSVSVQFAPTATGARTASVTITDNTPTGVETVSLSGTATTPAPLVAFNPSPVDFGTVVRNTQVVKTVTVSNPGSRNLVINKLSITGSTDYSFGSNNCSGKTIVPGGSCTVSIRFRPKTAGTRTATLATTDNAAPGSHSVTMTANAI